MFLRVAAAGSKLPDGACGHGDVVWRGTFRGVRWPGFLTRSPNGLKGLLFTRVKLDGGVLSGTGVGWKAHFVNIGIQLWLRSGNRELRCWGPPHWGPHCQGSGVGEGSLVLLGGPAAGGVLFQQGESSPFTGAAGAPQAYPPHCALVSCLHKWSGHQTSDAEMFENIFYRLSYYYFILLFLHFTIYITFHFTIAFFRIAFPSFHLTPLLEDRHFGRRR
jgi:hypothetical protein